MTIKYFFYCLFILIVACTVSMIGAYGIGYILNIQNPIFFMCFGFIGLITSGYVFTAKATELRYKNSLYVSLLIALLLAVFTVRQDKGLFMILVSFVSVSFTIQIGSLVYYLVNRNKQRIN